MTKEGERRQSEREEGRMREGEKGEGGGGSSLPANVVANQAESCCFGLFFHGPPKSCLLHKIKNLNINQERFLRWCCN